MRGCPWCSLAAILILVGLLPALYTSRRKVWVRADPAGDGAVLKVGGFALQRKPQFEDEFAKLLGAHDPASAERRPGASPEPEETRARKRERCRRDDRLQWARISNDAFNRGPVLPTSRPWSGYFAFLAFRREGLWKVSRAVAFVGFGGQPRLDRRAGTRGRPGAVGQHVRVLDAARDAGGGGILFIVEGMYKIRTLSGFALMFSVLTMAVAVTFLYVGPGPLVPALNSYWIKIHVQAAIWGSSLFALGGIATILYLAQDWRERRQADRCGAQDPPPIMGGAIDLDAPADLRPRCRRGRRARAPLRVSGRLPSAQTLDRVAYRIIAFAFPIWTFAVIAGAIWAQDAWGRYWGWDPKETWSFITWTVFAGYLHARATSGWKGRRASVIAIVGFVSLLDHLLRREPVDRGAPFLCQVGGARGSRPR